MSGGKDQEVGYRPTHFFDCLSDIQMETAGAEYEYSPGERFKLDCVYVDFIKQK